MEWDLTKLYTSYDDPKYSADEAKLDELIKEGLSLINEFKIGDSLQIVKKYLKLNEELNLLLYSLMIYSSLKSTTNVNDTKAISEMTKLDIKLQQLIPLNVAFSKFIKKVNIKELIKLDSSLAEYEFYLTKAKEGAKHTLSDKEESLYSKLKMTSSSAWGDMQSKLTSNLLIKVKGFKEKMPLSSVRNLAYDKDPIVRKNAYEAEIKAYKEIEESIAMALNNIKREANIMANLRHYKSVIDMTCSQSNVSKKTVEVMIEAINDRLPKFREYFKLKAHALGYKKGLPFYELFAPMGKLNKVYSYEEAKHEVLDVYKSFSDKLYNMGKRAFDEHWIDVLPHQGKVGGAFCCNLPNIKESRVLTNFTGQLSDIQTLAHELGHAYHGEVIADNKPLNWDYPMPLAETASILCQTLMSKKMISEIEDKEEKLSLVEYSLQEDTQCVVDILSRYLFESKVCNTPLEVPLQASDMNKLMIEAQNESYGDGLDKKYLHPYMWLCKSHYYDASYNFYNWPYAFGLLYGKGLYKVYLKDKEAFVKNYDEMLKNTTMMNVEDVAKCMGIDVTKKAFWIDALKSIEEDIDLFKELLSEVK